MNNKSLKIEDVKKGLLEDIFNGANENKTFLDKTKEGLEMTILVDQLFSNLAGDSTLKNFMKLSKVDESYFKDGLPIVSLFITRHKGEILIGNLVRQVKETKEELREGEITKMKSAVDRQLYSMLFEIRPKKLNEMLSINELNRFNVRKVSSVKEAVETVKILLKNIKVFNDFIIETTSVQSEDGINFPILWFAKFGGISMNELKEELNKALKK